MDSPGNTLRDYLAIVFRHKAVIITTFVTIMTIVFLGLEFKTPVYKASTKMLISGEKQTDSPYYRNLSNNRAQSYIALTQAEIVTSSHVLERAIKTLKLHERPIGYEKGFYTPLRQWFENKKSQVSQWLEDKKPQWLINLQQQKMTKLENLSAEQQDEFLLWSAIEGLRNRIEVTPVRDTDVFIITVSDFSPQEAAAIANVVSRSYIICDLEQQLTELQLRYGEKHQIVLQLKDNIDKMTNNLSGSLLPYMESIGPATIKVVEQARAPFMPEGANKHLTLILALCMSIVLGIMLSFGFEYINCTFKSPQEVEKFLNIPVLGSIPKKGCKRDVFFKDIKQTTPYAQFYKNLSDQIYSLMREKKLKSLLITAASPSEGSTAITANLGDYLAHKANRKVLIIDANVNSPVAHKIFNIQDSPGLADILKGKTSCKDASRRIHHNLAILPAGENSNNHMDSFDLFSMHERVSNNGHRLKKEASFEEKGKRSNAKTSVSVADRAIHNPATIPSVPRMLEVIGAMKEENEIILIDYANLRNVKDACALSLQADGVILVINEGKTRRHAIESLIAPLKQKNVNLVGVIFNNRTFAIPEMIYKRV